MRFHYFLDFGITLLSDLNFCLILIAVSSMQWERIYMMTASHIQHHIWLLENKFLVLPTDDIQHYFDDYIKHVPNPNVMTICFSVPFLLGCGASVYSPDLTEG